MSKIVVTVEDLVEQIKNVQMENVLAKIIYFFVETVAQIHKMTITTVDHVESLVELTENVQKENAFVQILSNHVVTHASILIVIEKIVVPATINVKIIKYVN
jgi:hypothetical protein